MSQQDRFDRILESLHDAALDDARWPAASALIDEACGARGSALIVGQGHSQEDGAIFLARFCRRGQRYEDREQWYFDDYFPLDERIPRVAKLPDSRLVRISDLYTPKELKTSSAYNEALPRSEYQNGLNVRLDGPDGSSIVWNLADSTEPGGWGSAQVTIIDRLLPHIRQFVRVRQALAAAEALGATLGVLLDSASIGVILLNWRGRIVETNDRARNLLQRGDGLFDKEGFLRARLPADNDRLGRLLARALPRFGSQAVSGSTAARRSSPLPALAVHVNPTGDGRMDFGTTRVAAVVLVIEPGRHPDIDPHLVATTLGLTAAESRVAVSLAAGNSVREIARATGRQENSVRFLLKKIYGKQGISRQADLVRLVLSLAGSSVPRR